MDERKIKMMCLELAAKIIEINKENKKLYNEVDSDSVVKMATKFYEFIKS